MKRYLSSLIVLLETFVIFGLGTIKLANGKSVGQLLSIKLIPSQLDFCDERKWRQPSIHEPKVNQNRARE